MSLLCSLHKSSKQHEMHFIPDAHKGTEVTTNAIYIDFCITGIVVFDEV